MKHLRLTFTDFEFEQLKENKGQLTWHDYIMAYATKIVYCSQCKQPIPQIDTSFEKMRPVWGLNLPFCSTNCFGKYFHDIV